MSDTLDLVFSASGPEVIFENFGDEMVIANLESGLFYSLDGSGADIWNALVAGHTGRQVAVAAAADLEGTAEIARFIAELRNEGLLAETAGGAQARPGLRCRVHAPVDAEIRRSAGPAAGRPDPRNLACRLALRPGFGRVTRLT